jgi:hypothetical protein
MPLGSPESNFLNLTEKYSWRELFLGMLTPILTSGQMLLFFGAIFVDVRLCQRSFIKFR